MRIVNQNADLQFKKKNIRRKYHSKCNEKQKQKMNKIMEQNNKEPMFAFILREYLFIFYFIKLSKHESILTVFL